MNINDIVKRENVVLSLKGSSRNDVLWEMIEVGIHLDTVKDPDILFNDLLRREDEFTTKIMPDISIPHAKSKSITDAMVIVGKSSSGISWEPDADISECPEKDRVYLIFMILVPEENDGNEHLKILATLARCLSHESFRKRIMKSDDADEIINIIYEKVAEIEKR